ncbi:hypothetical protein HDV05_003643 [Chytridiales sp. JEL 0842]|nr:hypothetical protein HDV05_003643 [Chytridiales sp. JEL 0842]
MGETTTDYKLVGKLGAWAFAGVVMNSWALTMARLPIRSSPLSYIGYATATTAFGYVLHKYETQKLHELEHERDKLVKRRMLAMQ